jgi:hypothetical protein
MSERDHVGCILTRHDNVPGAAMTQARHLADPKCNALNSSGRALRLSQCAPWRDRADSSAPRTLLSKIAPSPVALYIRGSPGKCNFVARQRQKMIAMPHDRYLALRTNWKWSSQPLSAPAYTSLRRLVPDHRHIALTLRSSAGACLISSGSRSRKLARLWIQAGEVQRARL